MPNAIKLLKMLSRRLSSSRIAALEGDFTKRKLVEKLYRRRGMLPLVRGLKSGRPTPAILGMTASPYGAKNISTIVRTPTRSHLALLKKEANDQVRANAEGAAYTPEEKKAIRFLRTKYRATKERAYLAVNPLVDHGDLVKELKKARLYEEEFKGRSSARSFQYLDELLKFLD